MYVEHPLFEQPSNLDEKIWRYMDFTKYMAMISDQCLYFSRADLLGDPFEGSYPKRNIEMRKVKAEFDRQHISPENMSSFLNAVENTSHYNRREIYLNSVNCWHLNNHESAAMWKLYLKSNEGIAVQSTYRRYRDAFNTTEKDVYIGQVRYLDYEAEVMPRDDSLFSAFLHKRKSFEHEREVRAVIQDRELFHTRNESMPPGTRVRVDLNKLIERVYVPPSSPEWFVLLLLTVSGRLGLNISVHSSRLDGDPLY